MRGSPLFRNVAARVWGGLFLVFALLSGTAHTRLAQAAPLGPYLNGAFPPTAPDSEFGGDRWKSELYVRDAALGSGAMPPLAKSIIDTQYTDCSVPGSTVCLVKHAGVNGWYRLR